MTALILKLRAFQPSTSSPHILSVAQKFGEKIDRETDTESVTGGQEFPGNCRETGSEKPGRRIEDGAHIQQWPH